MTLARPVDASARDENVAAHPLARLLALGRPAVMGVLNVTPDSFSDGGRFLDPTIAIGQARRMVAEGADIVDMGAESTRPYGGAVPVPIDEEMRAADACPSRRGGAGRAGVDRHHEGQGGGLGARSRRRDRQ